MIKPIPKIRFLILLSYYNRPLLLRKSLQSVLDATTSYPNWELAFGDDGSEIPGEPIVREVLGKHLNKVSFYNTHATIEDKIRDGITIGKLANQALSRTECDVCVTLCDDDRLHPEYLSRLARYFLENPDVMYCWSNIFLCNPLTDNGDFGLGGVYNEISGAIVPHGRLDGSQVAYRVGAVRENGIWYRETTKPSKENVGLNPWSYSLDYELFRSLYENFGLCHHTGFVSQYKGIHEQQLVFQKEHVFQSTEDILNYHRNIIKSAGVYY